LYLDRRLVS